MVLSSPEIRSCAEQVRDLPRPATPKMGGRSERRQLGHQRREGKEPRRAREGEEARQKPKRTEARSGESGNTTTVEMDSRPSHDHVPSLLESVH